ncbi:hypothetical protein KU306_12010 [Haloferax larsenii]|uniref:Uncharacterized protein n=1 Tax=Haloferax larsenii TaxID=302484 RepID=A0ABY5RBA8_HALLR|nr:hypothetical protein [Haloferax larsenii]UVE49631.1 hypothetical protein KU306_12010 [Haloferax larsenii]
MEKLETLRDKIENEIGPSIWSQLIDKWGWVEDNIFLLAVFVSILLLFPLSLYTSEITEYSFETLLTGAGSIGSVVLSFVLVVLYSKLSGIQKTQTKIQQRQQGLMEFEQIPRIIVNRWKVNDNSIRFDLTNVGKGTASNIGYVVKLDKVRTVDWSNLSRIHSDVGFHDVDRLLKYSSEEMNRNILVPEESGQFSSEIYVNTSQYFPSRVEYLEAQNSLLDDLKESDKSSDAYNLFRIRVFVTYYSPIESNLGIESEPSGGLQVKADKPWEETLRIRNVIDIVVDAERYESFEEAVTSDIRGGLDTSFSIVPENFSEERQEEHRWGDTIL